VASPLRGEANRPMGAGSGRSKRIPKHRNELPAWDGPVERGDDLNVRGFAATGTKYGSEIRGTRPDKVR